MMRIHFQLKYYLGKDNITSYNYVIEISRALVFLLSLFVVILDGKRINCKKKNGVINKFFFLLNIFWLLKQFSDVIME